MANSAAGQLVADPTTILNNYLSDLGSGLIDLGIANPQLDPGSDFYLKGRAICNQISLANYNILAQFNAQMVDTATGTDLDRIANTYGITRRVASAATGQIVLVASSSTSIPVGAQLTSQFGLIYAALYGYPIVNNGSLIEVQSVDTGSQTNLPVAANLTWSNVPNYCSSIASITAAITGGVDAENDDTLRQRIFTRLQNPPAFGNWQQIAELCQSFDPSIQSAFIYPAASGPGSQHIALVGYQTSSYVGRDIIQSPNLANIASQIFGNIPAYTNTVVTTVTNVPYNIAFNMNIPYPLGATNQGLGGGWVDINPWPVPNGATTSAFGSNFYYISVTSVISNTQFVVASVSNSTSIVADLTNIQWINKSDNAGLGWQINQSLVSSFVDNGNDTYTVIVSSPFVGIVAGDYIFPASVNAQNYLDAVLESFAELGPGQKTNSPAVLPNALRKPLTPFSYPDIVGSQFLKALEYSGPEVFSAQFWYGPGIGSHPYGSSEPPLPTATVPVTAYTLNELSSVYYTTIWQNITPNQVIQQLSTEGLSSAPMIYVPFSIGFYPGTG